MGAHERARIGVTNARQALGHAGANHSPPISLPADPSALKQLPLPDPCLANAASLACIGSLLGHNNNAAACDGLMFR